MTCRDRPDINVGRGHHERKRLAVLVLVDAGRRSVLNVVPDDDGPIADGHVLQGCKVVHRGADLPYRREVTRRLLLDRGRNL